MATGGSIAHVLAIDYALRPVLSSMGARHIAQGWFVLDRHITVHEDGTTVVETRTGEALDRLVDHFSAEIGSVPRLATAG